MSTPTAEQLRLEYGNWSEHPDVSVGAWKYDVANNNTRQGYWEFVSNVLAALEVLGREEGGTEVTNDP